MPAPEGVPPCPVLSVPSWFWRARDLHYRLQVPGLPPVDRPWCDVRLADEVQAAVDFAEQVNRERAAEDSRHADRAKALARGL